MYEVFFESHICNSSNQELEEDEIEIIEYTPNEEDLPNAVYEAGTKSNEPEEVYLVEIVEQSNQNGLPIEKANETIFSNEKNILKIKNDCTVEPDSCELDKTTSEEVPLNNNVSSTSTLTSGNQNSTVFVDAVSQNSREGSDSILLKTKSAIVDEGGIKKYKKKCPICGIMQQNLKQHMNVHSGVRRHVCSFCGKAFSQRGNLTCHLNIHTGYKPHKCDQCAKSFGDPTALKMHKVTYYI